MRLAVGPRESIAVEAIDRLASENGVETGCVWASALTDNALAAASMDGDETNEWSA